VKRVDEVVFGSSLVLDANTGKFTVPHSTRVHEAGPNEDLMWLIFERSEGDPELKIHVSKGHPSVFIRGASNQFSGWLAESQSPDLVTSFQRLSYELTLKKGKGRFYLLYRIAADARSVRVCYEGKEIELPLPGAKQGEK